MKYILSFLTLLFSYTLSAQTTTYITKDLDTVIVTTKQVMVQAKIPSKTIRDVIIKDTAITYKDTSYPSTQTTTVTKPYKSTTPTNIAPVARAGADQTITLPINSVILDASASTDADGTIATYKWSGLGGVIGAGTSRVTVSGLSEGNYTYRITVTDNKGATHFDELLVTVKPSVVIGTTVNFSFNQIPYTDPDIISPGRGAEQWHNSSARIPNPTESQPIGTENSLDVYYRFEAVRFYDAQGSLSWSYFDGLVQDAINKGQKLSFGIMTHNSDGGGGISYGGGESSYPLFLHNQMQSESVKDWLSGSGEWVANWNSQFYINWLRSLHTVVANRLKTQFYTPSSGPNAGKRVLFGDAIYVIDIRGYGNWGEWHSGGICDWNAYPSGTQPTSATLKAIIDAHTQIFDRWPLGMMIAAYDGGKTGIPLFVPLRDVAWYALTARNAWGEVGARRDQVGAPDGYLQTMLQGNDLTYNGSPTFATLFLEKWKNAPITGEPNPGVAPITGMADLLGQVNLYHHTSFGNGNYPFGSSLPLSTRNTIREAFKRAGYRIVLTGGKAVTSTGAISITLNWRNIGITPTYENWDVVYELVSGSTVAWTGTSTFKPKLFQPSATSNTIVDNFNNIPSGTYTLRVTVKDPANYRSPAPIAIQGRTATGSYILANSVSL